MKSLSKTIFWSIIYGVLVLPAVVSAKVGFGTANELENPIQADTCKALVEAAADAAMQIGLPIAAMFIIYSGFLFVTAKGNEEDLKKAKTTFMWAIIGTLVLLGAWTIASAISGTVQTLK